ncbi:iron ABC transporter permease [Tissierella sp. Yu-01]|uniref:FecCD family ABC transporter permease n=1 Tax=Tissierella sp. Yu-01 TaxID=3035694 RepID=UPI00240E8CBA|nr:iron ABC transporter permease [Tissierella sp. Yu-01]WFA08875.1 iron ABC transporter permease [Tissierella sp. Yu-01]
MKTRLYTLITILICIIVILMGIGIGSIYVEPKATLSILMNKLFSTPLLHDIQDASVSIVWNLRIPRTVLAFIVGGALAVSGTVMQSVLKNPLASSYTLGVSSGASVGAGIVILTGITIPVIGMFTLPIFGLTFGLLTVFLAVSFTAKLDKNMSNNTIILVGMVLSLFINAILTLMSALGREHIQQLIFWQMGSFSSREWSSVLILLPIVIIGVLILMRYSRELDLMTFGEEQASAVGVETTKVKWVLLGLSAALTGSAISFVGVIGFIDLIAPHVVRKFFGSSHKIVIPMSMFIGGAFMVICDLIARTIVSPSELPVGAITALVGAPFFAYVYFSKRKVR